MENETIHLPVLPLRGLTLFPHCYLNFDVERVASVRALERSMELGTDLLLVTQKEVSTEIPHEEDLYQIGTVGHVCQIVRLTEKSISVVVEGKYRARIRRLWQSEPYLSAQVEAISEADQFKPTAKVEALFRQVIRIFNDYCDLVPNVPDEVKATVLDEENPGKLADYLCNRLNLKYQQKQLVLEELRPVNRLKKLTEEMVKELHVLSMEKEVAEDIRTRVTQVQKNRFLQEQIKALQDELGDNEDASEFEEYQKKILKIHLAKDMEKKVLKDLDRLTKQPFGSQEGSVLRNYLDTVLEIPWNKETKVRTDIQKAKEILDKEHYGLDLVKESVLEFLAMKQCNPDAKGHILCLVGPPGVGKTSIALSVAKATNRKLARLSLGGVRDEADIRGHRKTYVGAMPGRIVEAVTRSGSMNPLIVLDEIDKLGASVQGDPASALLEVLDSEQNYAFRDHYIEIPMDLSKIMFITTANTTQSIPRPLLDRMDVIEINSYTDEEKIHIAKNYLIPKQRKENGLKQNQIKITDEALYKVISDYTRESGVRILERQIAKICRKTDMELLTRDVKQITITVEKCKEYLGTPHYENDEITGNDEIGLVNGLAWTESGGEMLQAEVETMPGTGKIKLTGNLGEVMKESAETALTCLRSRWENLGLASDFYDKTDIHIHFPEAAVPKDGPSAGITIATAILSSLTKNPVKGHIAMTGEITLRGRVLAIGGLKEKTMAALRNHCDTVIIPRDNVKDLDDIDPLVRDKLTFIPVSTIDQVFEQAFVLPFKKTTNSIEVSSGSIPKETTIRQ